MSARQILLDASQGKILCDLLIKNTTYLDVFAGEWRKGDIAIHQGKIVALDPGLKAKREIDGKKLTVVPGFIDAHVHVESSLVVPKNFEKMVLSKGTTSAVCDPHELTNVLGVKGLKYFLDESEKLAMNLRVMLSSCVPATHLETNGGGIVGVKDLVALKNHPRALGLAEMMNVPGVIYGDPEVHAKLDAFSDRPLDGHAPLLRGQALSAYALCGISSCHESSELEEAREKLTKGIAVWIREGSVAKDLHALAPLLTMGSSPFLGFCTDDRNPLDIASEGHLDFLIRDAIKLGVDPIVAYRAASFSVATHYNLHQGINRIGAIAPGYEADLVLLSDVKSCAIQSVIKSGAFTNELQLGLGNATRFDNTVHLHEVDSESLEGVKGRVHVIGVIPGKIITDRLVMNHDDPKVSKLSVIERHGNHRKPANAYAYGMGEKFSGAIASSVGHDSHNVCVVGRDTKSMSVAANAIQAMGGGFCVVRGDQVLASLPLPMGGLMSGDDPVAIEKGLKELRAASKTIGCELAEPFLQLAFLSLPVIPHLKLTDHGLVDVDQFKVIDVRAN